MFTLSIPITASNLDAIKLELTKGLPEVKSSHRCEAIARGFGFLTYATIRAALANAAATEATADGAAFTAYLADHGFAVPAIPFYRAVARRALQGVMERVPKLTLWGIGVGEPRRKADGKWETGRELQAKFVEERADLLSDYTIEPFLVALAFVSRIERTRTVRPKTNSYWLKHIAENYTCTYPEGQPLGPQYVANGVLIAAAVHAGFDIHTRLEDSGYDSLNATFNMAHTSLVNLDCEFRPDGARAQERRERAEMRAMPGLRLSYV